MVGGEAVCKPSGTGVSGDDGGPVFHLHSHRESGKGIYSRHHRTRGVCWLALGGLGRRLTLPSRYTQTCAKLIAQFKTSLNSLGEAFEIRDFVKKYDVPSRKGTGEKSRLTLVAGHRYDVQRPSTV